MSMVKSQFTECCLLRQLLLVFSAALLLITACSSSDTSTLARLVPPTAGTILINGAAAKIGASLKLGDNISAKGDDATASIRFDDGTTMNLYGLNASGGEAKLIVDSYDKSTKAMLARLLGGLLSVISPPKNPPPKKTIQALNTTTATEGTEFKVESTPAGDTVSLKVGKVTVTPKDGSPVTLISGQMLKVTPGGEPAKAEKYDANAASEKKFFVGPGEDVDKHY